MLWWILGVVTAVAVVGYIAHRWPVWFNKTVDDAAAKVNKTIDDAKN